MKIYLASSWKNVHLVQVWAKYLRDNGFEVDDFTDASKGRYVFYYADVCSPAEQNAKDFLKLPEAQKAFSEDKKWIDWSDAVLLILPSGKSSHLEAGYGKGSGKKLVIWQENFPLGEFDCMYGFADLITSDAEEVVNFFREGVVNG